MATRVCPECGSQYVASVRTCIDCDVALVDQVDPDAAPAAPAPKVPSIEKDQVEYELAGWGTSLKESLEGMLDRAGIRRAWEANALVVPAEFEAEVDRLVASVNVGVGELRSDVAQVAFEIEGIELDDLTELDARLVAAHLPHTWGADGSLLVAEDDEDDVAVIIDDVLAGAADEEVDGLAVQQVLSALYVAVDRLMKGADATKQRQRFLDASAAIVGLPVPYGLSDADWGRLTSDVASLAAEVRTPDAAEAEADGDGDGDGDGGEVEDVVATAADAGTDQDGGDDSNDSNDHADPVDGDADESESEDQGPSIAEQARSLRSRLHELV
jgi:hypothetical protein